MEPLPVPEQSAPTFYMGHLVAPGYPTQRTTGTWTSFTSQGLSTFLPTRAEALEACGNDEAAWVWEEEGWRKKNRGKRRTGKRGKNVSFPKQAVSNILFSSPYGFWRGALYTVHAQQLVAELRGKESKERKGVRGERKKNNGEGMNRTVYAERTSGNKHLALVINGDTGVRSKAMAPLGHRAGSGLVAPGRRSLCPLRVSVHCLLRVHCAEHREAPWGP